MALMNDLSESCVTILKSELLAAMKKNRDAHSTAYSTAMLGYRQEAIQKLQSMLDDAKSGKEIATKTDLDVPRSHTDDYDRVVRMLEMSTAEEIKVSESQFRQYILDEWSWKQGFETAFANYSQKVR